MRKKTTPTMEMVGQWRRDTTSLPQEMNVRGSELSAGMSGFDHAAQAFFAHMRIKLRGRKVGVTEQFLYGA
jgi:hypothetical protein